MVKNKIIFFDRIKMVILCIAIIECTTIYAMDLVPLPDRCHTASSFVQEFSSMSLQEAYCGYGKLKAYSQRVADKKIAEKKNGYLSTLFYFATRMPQDIQHMVGLQLYKDDKQSHDFLKKPIVEWAKDLWYQQVYSETDRHSKYIHSQLFQRDVYFECFDDIQLVDRLTFLPSFKNESPSVGYYLSYLRRNILRKEVIAVDRICKKMTAMNAIRQCKVPISFNYRYYEKYTIHNFVKALGRLRYDYSFVSDIYLGILLALIVEGLMKTIEENFCQRVVVESIAQQNLINTAVNEFLQQHSNPLLSGYQYPIKKAMGLSDFDVFKLMTPLSLPVLLLMKGLYNNVNNEDDSMWTASMLTIPVISTLCVLMSLVINDEYQDNVVQKIGCITAVYVLGCCAAALKAISTRRQEVSVNWDDIPALLKRTDIVIE